MNRLSATIFFLFNFLLFSLLEAHAESVKSLVLTNCEKATEEFSKLPEQEQIQLFDFFARVLELKSASLPDDPSARDPFILPIQPPGLQTLGKAVGEDYFRSISPTRDVDAKLCVLKIANTRQRSALQLIPGLFDLESSALLSEESRLYLRKSILEIAQANTAQALKIKEVLDSVSSKVSDKNRWLLTALMVEFGQEAEGTLNRLILDKEDSKFKAALNAIELSDHKQDIIAGVLESHSGKLSSKRVDSLIRVASESNLTSDKLFRFVIYKLAQPNGPFKNHLLKLVETSGEGVLSALSRDSMLGDNLSSIFLNLPLSEISHLVEMLCVSGRCDKVLKTIINTSGLNSGKEKRILELIALTESFDNDLWKFAEDIWKTPNNGNRVLAIRALSAFPGKKDQALGYLNQLIKGLGSVKKFQNNRSESVRAIAFAITRLSPVPATSISLSLGEEILGLNIDNSHLPALAISSIRPSPIPLLIKAIRSRSESMVDEALIAIERSRPLDSHLFVALLGIAGDTPKKRLDTYKKVSADRVISSYEDSALPILEQLAKGKDGEIARKAAIRILSRRSNSKAAKDLLLKNFSKLGCDARFEVISLLKEENLFKASQVKDCFTELTNSSYLKSKLAEVKLRLSTDNWNNLSTLLPTPFIFSECAGGNYLLPEDLMVLKLSSMKDAQAESGSQAIVAECGSRFHDKLKQEIKDRFIKILDDHLRVSSTLDLKALAASIRLHSHTETVEKKLSDVLKETSLSIALGELLIGSDAIGSYLMSSDNLLRLGTSYLVCQAQLKSNELKNLGLSLLPNVKEENLSSLLQTLTCLGLARKDLEDQLVRLTLTPTFEDANEFGVAPNTLRAVCEIKWDLRYIEKRFKRLCLGKGVAWR